MNYSDAMQLTIAGELKKTRHKKKVVRYIALPEWFKPSAKPRRRKACSNAKIRPAVRKRLRKLFKYWKRA